MKWKNDREKRLRYFKEYHRLHRDDAKKKREKNKHILNPKQKERRTNNRKWLIEVLGGCCSYCGSQLHLEIDHRDGNGTIERRMMKDNPASKYPILFRKGLITINGIQERLTVACRWCNILKGTIKEKDWRSMIRDGVILNYAQKMKEYNDYKQSLT